MWTSRTWLCLLVASNVVSWSLFAVYVGPGLLRSYSVARITSPFIAAHYGQADILEVWLQNGGNPNATESTGETLLQFATFAGAHEASACEDRFRTVSLLLELGADPNYSKYESIASPLMNVAEFGEFGTFVLLLEAGADPSRSNERGETVLERLERGDLPYREQKLAYLKAALKRKEPVSDSTSNQENIPLATETEVPSE